MATTVISCPKCSTPVRFRDGENEARCEACNTVIPRAVVTAHNPQAGDSSASAARTVMMLSLVAFAVGAGLYASAKKYSAPASAKASSSSSQVIYYPPSNTDPPPPARDEIAWTADARAPVLTLIDTDPVEDLVGFFRMWDGQSAWVSLAGAFDGASLALLWRTEPIDPQIIKREGIVPSAVVVGKRVVIADTSNALRVYSLSNGEKQATFSVGDAVVEMCKAPEPAPRIWVKVASDDDVTLDLDTGKAQLAPRPAWCPAHTDLTKAGESADAGASARLAYAQCHDEFRNVFSHATCIPGEQTPKVDGIERHYGIKDGALSVALVTKDDKPLALGIGDGGKATWERAFVADDAKPKPGPVHISELAFGRLYAVYEKVYFDSHLAVVDAASGATAWDVPLVGSLGTRRSVGRGDARAIVVTATRVYVPRSGGGLDVFDAKSGTSIGTIGKK